MAGKVLSPAVWYNGLVAASAWFQGIQDAINAVVDGTLSVAGLVINTTGNTTVAPTAGTLEVTHGIRVSTQGGLSIKAGSLQLNGDNNTTLSGIGTNHIIANPGSLEPSTAGGSGAGSSPTISIDGSDTAGILSVTTGSTPATSSTIVTVTLSSTVSSNVTVASNGPIVGIFPVNANAAALSGTAQVFATKDAASGGNWVSWKITSGSAALTASTLYIWYYHVIYA